MDTKSHFISESFAFSMSLLNIGFNIYTLRVPKSIIPRMQYITALAFLWCVGCGLFGHIIGGSSCLVWRHTTSAAFHICLASNSFVLVYNIYLVEKLSWKKKLYIAVFLLLEIAPRIWAVATFGVTFDASSNTCRLSPNRPAAVSAAVLPSIMNFVGGIYFAIAIYELSRPLSASDSALIRKLAISSYMLGILTAIINVGLYIPFALSVLGSDSIVLVYIQLPLVVSMVTLSQYLLNVSRKNDKMSKETSNGTSLTKDSLLQREV